MKHLFLLLLLTSTITFAQDVETPSFETKKNAIKIGPLRAVFYKFNLEYERKFISYFSMGAVSDLYHTGITKYTGVDSWHGIQTFKNSVYWRFYPWNKALKGFYLQGKIIMVHAYYSYNVEYITYKVSKNNPYYDAKNIIHYDRQKESGFDLVFGGSAGLGYQVLLGKDQRLLLDGKLEFQIVPPPFRSNKQHIILEYYDEDDNFLYRKVELDNDNDAVKELEWILIGPGSIIYPSLKVGYLF
ncbi:MAG TPA: hypothetical protein VIK89_02125 [Cytophagaceae bacterium]